MSKIGQGKATPQQPSQRSDAVIRRKKTLFGLMQKLGQKLTQEEKHGNVSTWVLFMNIKGVSISHSSSDLHKWRTDPNGLRKLTDEACSEKWKREVKTPKQSANHANATKMLTLRSLRKRLRILGWGEVQKMLMQQAKEAEEAACEPDEDNDEEEEDREEDGSRVGVLRKRGRKESSRVRA